jgi:hypothetical protein
MSAPLVICFDFFAKLGLILRADMSPGTEACHVHKQSQVQSRLFASLLVNCCSKNPRVWVVSVQHILLHRCSCTLCVTLWALDGRWDLFLNPGRWWVTLYVLMGSKIVPTHLFWIQLGKWAVLWISPQDTPSSVSRFSLAQCTLASWFMLFSW